MSEPAYQEVQLTGKQLVFWFMTALAVLVATFLLGVSVGRGVRANNADTVVDLPDAPPTGVSGSPTPSPTDLTFHDMLTTPKSATPSPTPDAPPAAGAPATKAGKPDPAPPKPAATPTPAPKSSPATSPVPGAWTLQVGGYKSKENADKQMALLKSKGYPAFVMTNTAGLYNVRVGQFASRAEAVAMQRKLESEGTKSLITR